MRLHSALLVSLLLIAPAAIPSAGMDRKLSPEQEAEQAYTKMEQQSWPPKVLDFLTDDLQAELGFRLVYDNPSLGVRVAELDADAVSHDGLQLGDRVLSAGPENDSIRITVLRGGHRYLVRLRLPQSGQKKSFRLFHNANSRHNSALRDERVGDGDGPAVRSPSSSGRQKGVSKHGDEPAEAESEPSAAEASVSDGGSEDAGGAVVRMPESKLSKKPFVLNAQKIALAGVGRESSSVRVPLTASASARVLANYNIELIIDASRSMQTRDCPGLKTRWQWCEEQAEELASMLSGYMPSGFTITTFNWNFWVSPNATASTVPEIFKKVRLEYGTRLAMPMADRLHRYFDTKGRNTHPLLICVITDGVPVPPPEPALVAQALITATRRMHDPNEATVVFFQIGSHDIMGKKYLRDLDRRLTKFGAKYDIVRTVSFDKLAHDGLAQALAECVQQAECVQPAE